MEIVVNDQTYPNWITIPADLREQIAASQPDTTGNGIPDVFEGDGHAEVTITGDTVSVSSSRTSTTSTTTSSVTVGGQDVKGWFNRVFRRS